MTKQEYIAFLEHTMRWFIDNYKESRVLRPEEDILLVIQGQINGIEIAWEHAHKLDPEEPIPSVKLIDRLAGEHNEQANK